MEPPGESYIFGVRCIFTGIYVTFFFSQMLGALSQFVLAALLQACPRGDLACLYTALRSAGGIRRALRLLRKEKYMLCVADRGEVPMIY